VERRRRSLGGGACLPELYREGGLVASVDLAVGVATDSAAIGRPDRDRMLPPMAVSPGSLSSALRPYRCFRTLASCRRRDGRSTTLA
jgi:hypothetical protein